MLKKKISEEVFHGQVADYLRLVLPKDAIWTSVEVSNQQGGTKGMIKQAKLRKKGVRTGWPDIQIFYREYILNSVLFLELKVGRNKPTEKQEQLHKELRDFGMSVEVVYTLEEVQDVLMGYEIIKKKLIL